MEKEALRNRSANAEGVTCRAIAAGDPVCVMRSNVADLAPCRRLRVELLGRRRSPRRWSPAVQIDASLPGGAKLAEHAMRARQTALRSLAAEMAF